MRLNEFIRADGERIVREWEEFAKTLRAGTAVPRWLLRTHAADVLQFVAQRLEAPQLRSNLADRPADSQEPVEHVTAAHVDLRIESGFDLVQIMAEYRALRACVLRLWREEDPNGFAKGADDISRFTEAVDQALGQTIRIFEQREAQYRDRFLAILGHDLRNPLNSILLSATSLAQARQLSEKQLAIVERITSSSRRLNFMVNDLLDFARGRLGSPMPISAMPTNLGALVPEVVDEVQSANPNVVIAIEMNGDLNGDWDTERLKQLLSNLLTNAVQHGSGKNVGVRLESNENIVSLEVHNDGAPIPEELLATMFDPLVHGQNPDQNRTGLGLGLFIVSEIASAHHGTIEVTSTQDAGTTFSVRLPRHFAVDLKKLNGQKLEL